ncbi:MAG: peptide chain release factor N(5)-glutamine methyltransferase [Deltaproteobacteria bacterium]|nr:peptide chain release factor N(5)-glutamine methyltransferase [Deltaproteobacteria bacterium]
MSPKTWHIKDLLKVSTDYLKNKGIENPRLNAEVLLAHQLNVERVSLYLNFDQPLTEKELSSYRKLIKRRLVHEPLQYITGSQEFWSLDFTVDRHVLIPRPETEIVVEQAIMLAKTFEHVECPSHKILDLGTGCGAIAVVLAKEIASARVWGTDISEEALRLAQRNANKHGVSDRLTFRQGDLWEALLEKELRFDMIVSNPPYVSSEEYNDLPPEVRDHEPRRALDGRDDGMYYLEKIIRGAHDFLNPGGWIVLEMAPHQTERALAIMGRTGGYDRKARIKDYSRCYRVVTARSV